MVWKKKEDLVGHSTKEVFGSPLCEQNLPYFQLAAKGIAQTFTREIITPAGEFKFLLTNYTPLRINDQIEGIVISVTDVTKLKTTEVEKEKSAGFGTHDFLTGLPNRVLIYNRIKAGLLSPKRTKSMISLMTLDLDGFKLINDEYGHPTGDLVLKAVAKRLLGATRESDTVAHVGDDGFLVLSAQVKSVENVKMLAKRILKVIDKKFIADRQKIEITASIGIAMYPENSQTLKALMTTLTKRCSSLKRTAKNNM